MPLFCLRRPEEWWGILQVCTRLSHLQPKRSIVRRLHMKFQEVWHFVSQTPANKNKPFFMCKIPNLSIRKVAWLWCFMFRLSVLLLIFNFSSNESRHQRSNKYFLDGIFKDWKRINPDPEQENPDLEKALRRILVLSTQKTYRKMAIRLDKMEKNEISTKVSAQTLVRISISL